MKRQTRIVTILLIGISLVSCQKLNPPARPLETPIPSPSRSAALTATPVSIPKTPPQIAFISTESGQTQLYRIDSKGTDLVQLTFDGSKKAKPAWSPDGNKLLYQIKQGDTWQIALVNWDGSNPVQLTSAGNNQNPSWSPDGASILFDSDRNGNRDIYWMESNGANQMSLTGNSANEFAPAYSPDGSIIAYLSEQDATQEECTQNAFDSCPQEVYFLDPDGVFIAKALDLKAYIGGVVWSPDSRLLAIQTSYFENSELSLYDLQSQTVKPFISLSEILGTSYPIGPGYFYLRSFSFSPNGNENMFCATQDVSDKNGMRMVYSGCYIINVDNKLFTLVRKETVIRSNKDLENAAQYSDAVWQP